MSSTGNCHPRHPPHPLKFWKGRTGVRWLANFFNFSKNDYFRGKNENLPLFWIKMYWWCLQTPLFWIKMYWWCLQTPVFWFIFCSSCLFQYFLPTFLFFGSGLRFLYMLLAKSSSKDHSSLFILLSLVLLRWYFSFCWYIF